MARDITVPRKGLGASYGRKNLKIEKKKSALRSRWQWHWTQATRNGRVSRMTLLLTHPTLI